MVQDVSVRMSILTVIKKIPAEWRCDEIFPIYPLILEYTTTVSNDRIETPISGNVNCTIDFGDGSAVYSYNYNNPTHRYTNPGTYIVSITGNCDSLCMRIPDSCLIKVISWGDEDFGYNSLWRAFTGCTNLSSIPDDTHNAFSEVTNCEEMFSGCTNLSSIPENLFKNAKKINSFKSLFYFCSGLTGAIPEKLFINCTEVTRFNSVFNGCTGLTSIGNNLFDNNKKITVITTTFYGCVNLTGNTPTGLDGIELWDRAGQPGYPTSVQGNRCFEGCTKLTNYAAIPRAWKQFN